MKILIAPDKFKGSLTAREAAERIASGLGPGFACRMLPLADGGEGTAEAIGSALGGSRQELQARDPLGRLVEASFVVVNQGAERIAVIDMSEASGLWRVAPPERDPWRASTYGTGQLIIAALEQGADRIVLGLGGSATNDGGAGMAQALGFVFLDADGIPVEAIPADLDRAVRIRAPHLNLPKVVAACDVRNPLLGPDGATRIYGAQKGISAEDFPGQEERLRHLASLVERDLGFSGAEWPGAGAAGGLGFGAMAFCRAELQSGFALVSDLLDLRQALEAADAVITGEGSLDSQTLNGKGPHGIALLARELGKPVVALAGRVEEGCGLEAAFDWARPIAPAGTSEAESIQRAGEWLTLAAGETADWLRNRFPG